MRARRVSRLAATRATPQAKRMAGRATNLDQRRARKERKHEVARQGILEAAAKVMAARGIDAVTMNDIASEAGYTPASLYTYFDSKDAIITALLTSIRERFMATFDERMPADTSLAERLSRLFTRQYELARSQEDAFAVFVAIRFGERCARIACAPKDVAHESEEGFFLLVAKLTDILAAPEVRAELGGHPPAEAALVLAGMGHAAFIQWVRHGMREAVATQVERLLGYFLKGLASPPVRV